MDIPHIYHAYTSNDIQCISMNMLCISMDISCIYCVDIQRYTMYIHFYGYTWSMDIHGISEPIYVYIHLYGYTWYIHGYTLYIPCICSISTYTWYILCIVCSIYIENMGCRWTWKDKHHDGYSPNRRFIRGKCSNLNKVESYSSNNFMAWVIDVIRIA